MYAVPAKNVVSAREQNYTYLFIEANSAKDFFLRD